ncbi:hypothetical protein MA16_Dca008800 [Dendrobium catenatum]|uniref:Uncharacterized protein n=1 Tax=Dendrobium catenatum TaxID=906689 RepID=A0A2I0VY70_9ASPA|nr:hypothetical protein MA16_Dca008800 [Dendrobium catenatum]
MPSPAQLLVPKELKFSDNKSGVLKDKNKKSRISKECHVKEVSLIGPLQKMPGIRRSKKLNEELVSSSIEQMVNVVDKSVDGKLKELDLVDQWQEVFSETFCGGDASSLVNYA